MFSDMKIEDKNSKFAYIQIRDYIKGMILRGLLRADEKLPSSREMASMLNISRNTVMYAYEFLQDEGFVYIKKGRGTFVSDVKVSTQEKWDIDWENKVNAYGKLSEKLDIIKHETKWKRGMISFKSIAPDENLFNIEEFKKSFLNRMSIEGKKILNYGYAQGYKLLIEYLLKYMENKGVDIKGKDILITNGFTEGFDLVLSCLTNKGDSILCENPTHNTAIKIMKLHGLNIKGVQIGRKGVDLNELKEKLKKEKFKISYFIPSYHNPTGIVMPPENRAKLYNILKGCNVPIIEDGFNEELRYSGAHVLPIAAIAGKGNSVIYIGSFSKVLFPGIRIGWILSDKVLTGYLESIKRARNIHTSSLDQAIFYEYLQSGDFNKYIKKARRIYREKYEFALKCAKNYIPSREILGEGGMHIFIKLKGINSRQLLEKCCRKNVIFTPGDIFYVDDKGQDTLRLGFSRVSKEDIKKGFSIIGEEVRNLGGI
ncbi:MAG TPA: PLP-dependent aminotransferase family protein [Clostridium sp.]|jgi:DNA-binding transcriptional MocR family regulator|uniref:PLP-dependent aminotransferase family protein n=1 Tax=Clostridium lapidicellarium TaxID=3240931 RepID=A0ABV4DWR0_9CLOT|nr:PLP-dependent aminotransferase family protein [Clostridiales bacterium]HBC97893.1 PLP-dependent aminotransferase family protein [Clostridium sp.]